MPFDVSEPEGIRVLECACDGPTIRDERDAVDLISAAFEHRAAMVALPAGRLDADFFRLSSGSAGAIIQKFALYHLRLVIIGDVSKYVIASDAFRDLVREANRSSQLWFVRSRYELVERIGTEVTKSSN